MLVAILTICGAIWYATCTSNDGNTSDAYVFIPKAPDYDNTTMWVTADGDTDNTGADIFYGRGLDGCQRTYKPLR